MDIFKASAGSGKTFSLTIKYLSLLLENTTNYRHILAVTFTNKATAEMKERIIEVLMKLASKNKDADSYLAELQKALPQLSKPEIHSRADLAYRQILHDYSRFSVATIDKFVQKIIRSFAWELGIDGGFKLQLNADPVKEDLATRMYLRLDDDAQLQNWVVKMATERLEDGKRWDFRGDMLKLADELFKEKFRDFETALQGLDNNQVQQKFQQLRKQLQSATHSIESKMKLEADKALKLLADNGLSTTDFSGKKSSFANYFNKASENPMGGEYGKKFSEVLVDETKMVAKTSPKDVKDKIAGISSRLLQIVQSIKDHYDQNISEYNTASLIQQHFSLLFLNRIFAEELSGYRKDNNALLISDTHFLLNKLTEDASASFIYEKTGQRYQHYLIDEFQDTSAFQWNNFIPLLTESLGQGNYNLIVGDVKQAIYRWRNGDWRLLLQKAEQDLKAFKPQVNTLQENYRSTLPVIHFNNYLFRFAPALLQDAINEKLNEADSSTQQLLADKGYYEIFNQAYEDSYQQPPNTAKSHGQVLLKWLVPDEEKSYDEQALDALYLQVKELLQQGYQPSNLAVLTRKNEEARKVVEHLVQAQQNDDLSFGVISGDALLLNSNQAVQIILCALRWLHHPGNSIAMAQLRQLLLLQHGVDPNRCEVFMNSKDGDFSMVPPDFLQNRNQLKTIPLVELVHQLIMIFDLQQQQAHKPYLLAFADKVHEWVRYGEASLLEFLQYWDDEGNKLSLPAGSGNNAIEVVTVHKSKGLAYDIVLMPFLDWPMLPEANKAPTLWVNNSTTPFNEINVVPVKYIGKMTNSAFALDYFEEMVLAAMDNLNVLYVAFTRARQRIYGWAPVEKEKNTEAPKKPDALKNIGELMKAVANNKIVVTDEKYDDASQSFDPEELCWNYGNTAIAVSAQAVNAPTDASDLTYTHWPTRLQVKYQPLTRQQEDEWILPRKQGILMHEVLSSMKKPNDLEAALNTVKRAGWLDDYQLQKIRNILEPLLKMEALQPWYTGQYKRLAERNIVTGKKELRRPDLILYNEQQCLVYDFKFTADKTDQKDHQQQVKEYMQLLTTMGFAPAKGFVIYGLDKKVTEVSL